jgi:hypothetical protein
LKRIKLKSLVSLGIAVVFSISAVISVSAATSKTTTKPYVGYLMDAHCAKTGVDDETGKVNVKKNPEKHTTSCLKIDMCMMEGLGVMVKQSNGTYKFYKFDKAGNKKADDKIMMMTKRKFGNKISVTGTLSGTTLKVSSIKEVK